MKELRVLLTCAICGDSFDSDYRLIKHMSKSHPGQEKDGWVGGEGEGEHNNCSCGGNIGSSSSHMQSGPQ